MLALAALTCCTDAHSEEEAEVEAILAHKYNAVDVRGSRQSAAAHSQDRLYYLIKWLGTPGDQSWEAEVRGHKDIQLLTLQEDAVDADDLVLRYWTEQQGYNNDEAQSRVNAMRSKGSKVTAEERRMAFASENDLERQEASRRSSPPKRSARQEASPRKSRRTAPSSADSRSDTAAHTPQGAVSNDTESTDADSLSNTTTTTSIIMNLSPSIPTSLLHPLTAEDEQLLGLHDESISSAERQARKEFGLIRDWDPYVDRIETLERTSHGHLMVYIVFQGGIQLKIDSRLANRRCPQTLLAFYEKHLRFHTRRAAKAQEP